MKIFFVQKMKICFVSTLIKIYLIRMHVNKVLSGARNDSKQKLRFWDRWNLENPSFPLIFIEFPLILLHFGGLAVPACPNLSQNRNFYLEPLTTAETPDFACNPLTYIFMRFETKQIFFSAQKIFFSRQKIICMEVENYRFLYVFPYTHRWHHTHHRQI